MAVAFQTYFYVEANVAVVVHQGIPNSLSSVNGQVYIGCTQKVMKHIQVTFYYL